MSLEKMYEILSGLGETGHPLDTGDALGLPFEPFLERYRHHLGDPIAFKHYFGPHATPDVVEGTRRLAVHLGLVPRELADQFDVVAGAGTLHLYEMICRNLIQKPGDAIIVPVPTYGRMISQIKTAGGTPVFVSGRGHHPIEDLEQVIEEYPGRVVGLLHINPNTYGYGYGEDEVDALARLCREHNIVLIEDFALFPLAAKENSTPVVSAVGRGCEAVALIGLSKPFGLTNARLSVALADPRLAEALHKDIRASIGFVGRPLLNALGDMFTGDMGELDQFLKRNNAAYQMRRKVMIFGLQGFASEHLIESDMQQLATLYPESMHESGLSPWLDLVHDPEWGMFVMVDCSKLIEQVDGLQNGMDVFIYFAEELGVRSIPPEALMIERPELRLSFSCEPRVIVDALVALYDGLRNRR